MNIDVIVLGRDRIGAVAESDRIRYYLTDCCGASAKGCETGICCRSCYADIDPRLGDVPDKDLQYVDGDWIFVHRLIQWTEVYGDGIPYDDWEQHYAHRSAQGV